MAVVYELELLRGGLFAVDMFAFWEDSVGDKLIPLTMDTCVREETLLISDFRMDSPQRHREIGFTWSLRTNF